MEDCVDFLEAAVGFDSRWALRVGADELLKDGTSHGRMSLFKVGIPDFEERGWNFVAGGIQGKNTFKLANGFLKPALSIITFA